MKTVKFIAILTQVFFLCLAAGAASARISFSEAGETARNWIAENFDSAQASRLTGRDGELHGSEIKRNGETAAYSFERPDGGFVLVSGCNAGRVIAFSEKNAFNPDIPAVAAFLDSLYASSADSPPESGVRSQAYQRPIGRIGPLLRTQWGQWAPYNFYCPTAYTIIDGSVVSRTAPVGCVAVAMGQIMRYHRHPSQGYGSREYEWDDGRGSDISLYADFRYPYDWSNMPARLVSGSTEAEIAAVAKLLFHAGVAVEMDYGYYSSGAYSADVVDAIREHFDYSFAAEYIGRDFDTEQWFEILAEEIINARPVYYRGFGHAFVLDGIDDRGVDSNQEILVHLNYGWEGDSDGWYNLNFFHDSTIDYHVTLGITPTSARQPHAPSGTTAPGLGSSGCFIATAAYGSYNSPEVRILRSFRDGFTAASPAGRNLAEAYYRISPIAGGAIEKNIILKTIFRLHIAPVVLTAGFFFD